MFKKNYRSNYSKPAIDLKISIGNISKKISNEDLRKMFKDCGEIRKINITRDPEGLNHAEIFFVEEKSLMKALDKNGIMFKDNIINITCEYFKSKAGSKNKNTNTNTSPRTEMKKEECLSLSEEERSEEISDNEGYQNFLQDYSHYFKSSKKAFRKSDGDATADVPEMLREANNLYLSNQFDEAIPLLHSIITAAPDLQEPYQILSLIYEEKGDIHNALSFLMLAAQLSHGESEIWIRCANLNKQIKNIQQAEYCVTRAVKLEKNNIYFLYERALLQEELGNFKKAALIYEKILKLQSNQDILLHIVQIYEKLKVPEKAMDVLQNNLEHVPRKLKVLIKLYDLYIQTEKYEKGVQLYQQLSAIPAYENTLANSNMRLRYLFCCLELRENISLSTTNSNYSIPDNANIISEIINEFSNLISTGLCMENELELIQKLFFMLHRKQKIEQFISIYEDLEKKITAKLPFHMSQLNQLNPEIYIKIAEHFYNMKNYHAAIDFYNKSLNISKNDLVRIKLSEIYGILGNNEKALEILKENFFSENKSKIPEKTENENEIIYDEIIPEDVNPFHCENLNLQRDFLENQLREAGGNIEDNMNNMNILDQQGIAGKKNSLLPHSGMVMEYSYPLAKSKSLGKKRLRLCSRFRRVHNPQNIKNSQVIDYNFDAYLKKRNKSTVDTSSHLNLNKTIYSLKLEYDELTQEIAATKGLYLKLQQSLLMLQTNQMEKFCENTFIPLKQTLIQELKIEEFKTGLFNYILEKSHIKNFFKIKDSVFDLHTFQGCEQYENIEEELNENLNIKNAAASLLKLEEEEEEIFEKKDTLFVRKTNNKSLLSRKKVGKTIELVEKQIGNLENIDKFINPENFIRIIENFLISSYREEKYTEGYTIISLIINSDTFKHRNDYFSFNIVIYAIMICFKIKLYKIAFELVRKLMIQFDLKDFPYFWIVFWLAGKELHNYIVRSYMYKLNLNENYESNVYLQMIKANCFFNANNFEMSLRQLAELYDKKKIESPYFLLMMALNHLFIGLNRNSKTKEASCISSVQFMNYYSMRRIRSNELEVLFNLGRFFQFLGHDREAYRYYNELLSKIDSHNELMHSSCIYNQAMLLKKAGNDDEAHRLLMDNIII